MLSNFSCLWGRRVNNEHSILDAINIRGGSSRRCGGAALSVPPVNRGHSDHL